jgi:membrane protein
MVNQKPADRVLRTLAYIALGVAYVAATKSSPVSNRGRSLASVGAGDSSNKPDHASPPRVKRAVWRIAVGAWRRFQRDNASLVAAGIAFYVLLAVFPALAVFVSIYGLFADANTIQQQTQTAMSVMPAQGAQLLGDSLHSLVSQPRTSINLALVMGLALALWSAKAGVSALMTGLNIAYEKEEKRSFFVQQAIALALTFGGLMFSLIAISAVAILPAILDILPFGPRIISALVIGRWPLIAALMGLALAIIYQIAPCSEHRRWRWITWGAGIATLLWIAGSALFSAYVAHFGSYNATFGSLAAVVILLLWFWLSALLALLGAEIDAEIECYENETRR